MSKEKAKVWGKLIEEWESSGLSQVEFCKGRGLKLSTFYGWKSRLKSRGPIPVRQSQLGRIKISSDQPRRFVEAVVSSAAGFLITPRTLTLKVGERFSLELESEFDEALLLNTLKILAKL